MGVRLYIPQEWTNDPVRCAKTHIPADIKFATKPEIALDILDAARSAHVAHRVVTADSWYGDSPTFLAGLETRQEPYIVRVGSEFGVRAPASAAASQPPWAANAGDGG